MDEAERCHALAILDEGRLVAEGSPDELARDINARVVLVESDQPRRAGKALSAHQWVKSVAQIGKLLRVLIDKDKPQAELSVRETISAAGLKISECRLDSASLEDVFVAATLSQGTDK